MVPEVGAHPRGVLDNRNPKLFQLIFRADAREHQNVGRFQRTSRKDNLVALHGEYLSAALNLNANDLAVLREYPTGKDVASDGQV